MTSGDVRWCQVTSVDVRWRPLNRSLRGPQCTLLRAMGAQHIMRSPMLRGEWYNSIYTGAFYSWVNYHQEFSTGPGGLRIAGAQIFSTGPWIYWPFSFLQKSDVGLSEEQLEQLLDRLDVDGDGEIEFRFVSSILGSGFGLASSISSISSISCQIC